MEKKRIQNYDDDIRTFQSIQGKFLESTKGSVYHYCSLDTLWKILDGNSLLATHVEFSNDTEEYNLGKRFFGTLLKEVNKKNEEVNKKNDDTNKGDLAWSVDDEEIEKWENRPSDGSFMVCFCEEPNILSQWREYARNGVSIELALNYLSLYTIHNLTNDNDYITAVNMPKRVIYIDEKDLLAIKNSIHYKKFSELENIMESSATLVPYIKHKGFEEEKEVRFIFSNTNNYLRKQIDYLDRKGMKVPVIKIMPYQGSDQEVRIYANFNLKERLEEKGIDTSNLINRIFSIDEISDDHSKNYFLGYFNGNRNKKIVFITNNANNKEEQEQVYNQLMIAIHKIELIDIDVQCEGFLPIKSIMIGPCKQQNEIKRGVEEYLKRFYCWRNVKVVTSDIPYRSEKSDVN